MWEVALTHTISMPFPITIYWVTLLVHGCPPGSGSGEPFIEFKEQFRLLWEDVVPALVIDTAPATRETVLGVVNMPPVQTAPQIDRTTRMAGLNEQLKASAGALKEQVSRSIEEQLKATTEELEQLMRALEGFQKRLLA